MSNKINEAIEEVESVVEMELGLENKPNVQAGFVEVRLLISSELGAVNEVIKLPRNRLKNFKVLGFVDDNPDAVAYAKTLVQK